MRVWLHATFKLALMAGAVAMTLDLGGGFTAQRFERAFIVACIFSLTLEQTRRLLNEEG